MSEFTKRAITGAVYVALTLGAALAGPVTSGLLFFPVCLLAANEMGRLCHGNEHSTNEPLPLLLAATVYIVLVLVAIVPGFNLLPALAVIFLLVLMAVVKVLWAPQCPPAVEMGSLLMVIFLVAVPFGLIPLLLRNGHELFIGFMALLWTNDTGAYLVGRAIGRTPLLPRVSPKKTVEGLIGGIVLALVCGMLLALAWPVLTTGQWLLCATAVALVSTLGDLLESALKRHAGVKDSGKILPGHGGILDRFDGFLLAIPAMTLLVHMIGQ